LRRKRWLSTSESAQRPGHRIATRLPLQRLVEFFRAKDDRFFGPISLAQLLSLTVALLGGWLMLAYRAPRAQPQATPA